MDILIWDRTNLIPETELAEVRYVEPEKLKQLKRPRLLRGLILLSYDKHNGSGCKQKFPSTGGPKATTETAAGKPNIVKKKVLTFHRNVRTHVLRAIFPVRSFRTSVSRDRYIILYPDFV